MFPPESLTPGQTEVRHEICNAWWNPGFGTHNERLVRRTQVLDHVGLVFSVQCARACSAHIQLAVLSWSSECSCRVKQRDAHAGQASLPLTKHSALVLLTHVWNRVCVTQKNWCMQKCWFFGALCWSSSVILVEPVTTGITVHVVHQGRVNITHSKGHVDQCIFGGTGV